MLASGTGLHVPEVVTGLICGLYCLGCYCFYSIQKTSSRLKQIALNQEKRSSGCAFVFQIRKAFIKHKIHAASRIE
jgi:hypothetical protein